MFVVQVLPSAEADVAQIRDWYEQQAELGEAFVTEFESLLGRLRQLPERFPEVREDIRRSLFGRFRELTQCVQLRHVLDVTW